MCATCGCDNYADHGPAASVRMKQRQSAHPGETMNSDGKALRPEMGAGCGAPGSAAWLKKEARGD
jgi:hypothetical protein